MLKANNNLTSLELATAIKALNQKWKPHPGQIPVGKALFGEGKKRVFLSIGRQWGKTAVAVYSVVRWASTKKNQMCFYFGPKQKQVEDIMWRRICNMVPMELVSKVMNSRKEIHFKNGSIIHVRGSDDPDISRGLTPNFCVYEEYKDFKPYVHDDIIGPALAARGGTLLVIGTPPDHENFFTELADQCKNGDPTKYAYFEGATLDNPYNDREAVLEEIERLKAKGEFAKVWREYFGKFVPGGSNNVFPMFNPDVHVKPHVLLMNKEIKPDIKRFEWVLMTDPGTTTVFAAVFVAIHPYTKHIYVLDEIYETDRNSTSTSVMWERMQEKANDLYPQGDLINFNDWVKGYDQAAAWFANEMSYNYGVGFLPTDKVNNKKEAGVSLLKDIFLMGLITISDRCENTIKEIAGYRTNDRGEFIKKNDHCVTGDTLILTDKGQVPIKDLDMNHKVLTREGFRDIIKKWDNGVKPIKEVTFSDGSKIRVTEDHKVFTLNRGFIQVKDLNETDSCIKVKGFKSNIEGLNSENILMLDNTQIESIIGRQLTSLKRGLGIYTGLSMKQRLALFLKDMKYTIKMGIQKITNQVTLKPSQERNTNTNIKIGDAQKLCEEILIQLDPLQKNGMGLKRVINGILKILRECGRICLKWARSVLSVIRDTKSILTWPKNPNIVILTVKPVLLEDAGHQNVYDLTINKNHEYFANNILIHNCIDTLRYILGMTFYDINQAVPPSQGPSSTASRRHYVAKRETGDLDDVFEKFTED